MTTIDETAQIVKPFAGHELTPRSLRLLNPLLDQFERGGPGREPLHVVDHGGGAIGCLRQIDKVEAADQTAPQRPVKPG